MPAGNDRYDRILRPGELNDYALQARAVSRVQTGGDEHGERRGVALDLGHGSGPVVAGQTDAEGNLERDHKCEREEEEAGEEPPPHWGTASLKPTPRLVSIHLGSPSFLRIEAMWTSTVFEVPYQ